MWTEWFLEISRNFNENGETISQNIYSAKFRSLFIFFSSIHTEPDDFKEPWHYTYSHKKLYRIHKSHVTLCYITNITNYRTHYEREIALKEHEQTIAGRKSENKN